MTALAGTRPWQLATLVDESGNTISGSGGGPATIADGDDVAQGTTTDLASANTVIGLLKNLKAGIVANTTYTTSQVSPTAVAATLIAADAARKVLGLQALSANTQSVFVGKATVTPTTGFELRPGAEKWFTGSDVPVALMQAISTSGTQIIIVTVGV